MIARALPKGWRAADAESDGWTSEVLAAAPRWVPIPSVRATDLDPIAPEDAELPDGCELREPGLYIRTAKGSRGSRDSDSVSLRVRIRMRVRAVAKDECGEEPGRLIEYADQDGNPRRVPI